jgi:hypothetical protein
MKPILVLLKRYAPIVSVLILAGQNVAKLLGLEWLAAALQALAGMTGGADVPPGIIEGIASVIATSGALYAGTKKLYADLKALLKPAPSA